jgi:hypothetical protein
MFVSLFLIFLSYGPIYSVNYSSLKPEITIKKDYNDGEPVCQGRVYKFEVNQDSLKNDIEKAVKKKVEEDGGSSTNYSAEVTAINSINWYLIDGDMNKIDIRNSFSELISDTSNSSGIEKSILKYSFYYPTDPMKGYILVVEVDFDWRPLKNNSPQSSPITTTSYGKIHLKVLDLIPPDVLKLTPEVLYGFCGKKISEYNE